MINLGLITVLLLVLTGLNVFYNLKKEKNIINKNPIKKIKSISEYLQDEEDQKITISTAHSSMIVM